MPVLQNLAEDLPPAVRLWAVDTAIVVPSRTVKSYAKAYAYRQVRCCMLTRLSSPCVSLLRQTAVLTFTAPQLLEPTAEQREAACMHH